MSSDRGAEQDYRQALYGAERALMHALKWLDDRSPLDVRALIQSARVEASRVLDIGRDEANEQVAT